MEIKEERYQNEVTTFSDILQFDIAFDWSIISKISLSFNLFADLRFPRFLKIR